VFLGYFGFLQSVVKWLLYCFPFGLFTKKSFLRLGFGKGHNQERKARAAWEARKYFSYWNLIYFAACLHLDFSSQILVEFAPLVVRPSLCSWSTPLPSL